MCRLDNNQLCGIYYEYGVQKGTYTAEGILAISNMLGVNGTLRSVRCDNVLTF